MTVINESRNPIETDNDPALGDNTSLMDRDDASIATVDELGEGGAVGESQNLDMLPRDDDYFTENREREHGEVF